MSKWTRTMCKCYHCGKWVKIVDAPKIRVDMSEGPSYYTVGRVCKDCRERKPNKGDE